MSRFVEIFAVPLLIWSTNYMCINCDYYLLYCAKIFFSVLCVYDCCSLKVKEK